MFILAINFTIIFAESGVTSKTLPNRKALVRLFDKLEQGTMKEGDNLASRIIELHKRRYISVKNRGKLKIWREYFRIFASNTHCRLDFCRQGSARKRKGPISGTRGMERFRSEEAFYVNPLPDCLCQREESNSQTSLVRR